MLGSRTTRAMVAAVDWQQLKPLHEARRVRPFLRIVGQPMAQRGEGPSGSVTASPVATPGAAAAQALLQRLQAVPAAARRDLLVEFVLGEVSAVLALPAGHEVALGVGLFDLGMDSLMAVELKRRLERGVGRPLPSTLTFNYPNIGALAAFLDSLLAATQVGTGAAGTTPAAQAVKAAQAMPVTATPPAAAPAAPQDIDTLSEDELEQQLLARLERLS
jgi:hypothetical protein